MWKTLKNSFAAFSAFGGRSRRKIPESEVLNWIIVNWLITNSDDAIIGESLDGRITRWNAGAERVYGYSSAEMIGSQGAVLVPCERFSEMQQVHDQIRKGEQVCQFQTERFTKSGERIQISLAVLPVQLATDGSLGALSIARELTRRKSEEAELANASGILGQLAQTTIHSLRNCLHVISGNEEMLSLSVGDDPTLCWHAAEIRNSVERATELVSRLQTLGQTGWLNGAPGESKSPSNGAQPELPSAD